MTEVRQTAGGPATPSTTLVQCDQITIVGDGSHERPLRATGAGTGSGSGGGGGGLQVISDQVTVVGLGTAVSPLRAGDVPVSADGSTILGNGTRGNPLRSAVSSTPPVVVADQVTILGDGTTGDPLRAAASGSSSGDPQGTFRAVFRTAGPAPRLGSCVMIAPDSESDVLPTVQGAWASEIELQSTAIGMIAQIGHDGTVLVRTSGVLTLPASAWSLVVGRTTQANIPNPPVTTGMTYYLNTFSVIGGIVDPVTGQIAPNESVNLPAICRTRVGVGLSSTSMLVCPAPPVRNLGDVTLLANVDRHFGTVAQPPIGSVVFFSPVLGSSGKRVLDLASSDAPGRDHVAGILVRYDVALGVLAVVQHGGVVFLDEGHWDAVIDDLTGGGLIVGSAYYLTGGSSPGRLTAVRPPSHVVQVGVAISANELILSTPSVSSAS